MGEIFERFVPSSQLEWTGERLTTAVAGQVEVEHLHRYFLARELCRGLDVLDVASGEGYGTALLAQVAASAVGVELSPQAARHAAANYRFPNLRYLEGDARKIPLGDASVDLVISFETIEHFYEQETFLSEVKRVLRPGGRFVVSSPDRDVYSPLGSAANPYHVKELTRSEFERLLQKSFKNIHMLSQRPMLGSALVADSGAATRLTFERRGEQHFETSEGLPRPIYLVAVASDAALPTIPDSLYVDTGEIGALMSRPSQLEAAQADAVSSREALARALSDLGGARDELTRCVEQAQAQAQAQAEEIMSADRQLRSVDQRLEAARVLQRSDFEGELVAAKAEAAAKAQNEIDAIVAAKAEAAAEAQNEIDGIKAQLDAACAQRDVARLAVRRAALFAEQTWRTRLTEAEQRAADADRAAAEWQARYERLHLRLIGILRRTGVVGAARLLPRNLRWWVRTRIFSGGLPR